MNNRDRKKKFNPGALIIIAVVLLASEPEFFAGLLTIAIFLGIIASPFIIIHLIKKNNGRTPAARRQQETFDECPKPFCFHKDKGEHHVRKGKEIDPWDRPDIDIRKYQRRQ